MKISHLHIALKHFFYGMAVTRYFLKIFFNLKMRIKITFLRHGETDGNVEGIYQGQMNYNLTLNGQNQAKITSNYLQNNNNWLLIFSSDLTRAKKVNYYNFNYILIIYWFLLFRQQKLFFKSQIEIL